MQFISNPDVTPNEKHGEEKPQGREYLIQDEHNERKGHHIIVTDEGETWYNQAINAPSTDGWYDFYEWQLVGCMEWHGYRKAIDVAVIKSQDEKREELREELEALRMNLDDGDHFEYWNNQGYRDAVCVGVAGDQALVVFTMPQGRDFFHVVERKAKRRDSKGKPVFNWLRTVQWHNIPKKFGH